MSKKRSLARRKWRLIIYCGLLGAAFLSFGLVLFLQSLESYLVFDKPLAQADAIVVMAGSLGERLPAASFLFKQGRGPKIILTNDGIISAWSELFQRNLFEIEWAEQELIKAGVPAQAIIKLPFTASGTYFDAKHTVEYALENNISSLFIVTSDYHTRRSHWTFSQIAEGLGLEFGTYPAYSTKLIGGSTYLSRKRAKRLFVEFIKLIYYQIRYRFKD